MPTIAKGGRVPLYSANIPSCFSKSISVLTPDSEWEEDAIRTFTMSNGYPTITADYPAVIPAAKCFTLRIHSLSESLISLFEFIQK
jgi:hypothetical protein